MYDKNVMPVIDDLYFGDGTQLKQLKYEDSNQIDDIFSAFTTQIENEITEITMQSGCSFIKNEE